MSCVEGPDSTLDADRAGTRDDRVMGNRGRMDENASDMQQSPTVEDGRVDLE